MKESSPNLGFTWHKLVLTRHSPVPVEINARCITQIQDSKSDQEEADVIIIHQLLSLVQEERNKTIKVLSDDTDVFVLPLHFYN